MSHPLFCVIGTSGSGKTTIVDKINLPKVISYKTRNARPGEVDGVDSYFISRKRFESMDMIISTEYAGNLYGITQGEILGLEESPMIYVIDYESFIRFKENLAQLDGYKDQKVVSVFIYSSEEEVKNRMIMQGRTKEEIEARLGRVSLENANREGCDYVIHNETNQIESSVNQLANIIFKEVYN